jgi:NAD(P)-dependent dehydrogenase (short-subunit alcohol dehydrogenase family)
VLSRSPFLSQKARLVNLDLENRTVLVTGSTLGIGRAVATRFAQEGAEVLVHGRNEARTQAAAEALRAETKHSKIRAVFGDLATAEGANQVIAQAPAVDVLINNAGMFEPRAFADIADHEWLTMFETNVMSGIRLSRHYFPAMLTKGWGRIVFVSSESALQVPPEMIHYGLTKTAQLAVSRGLAELTRGTAVTVNAVLPGPTRSEGVNDFVQSLAKDRGVSNDEMERLFFTEARPTSLLQRFLTVEEIANLIVYVASPLASGTNGAALRVDGGVARSVF